MFFAAFLLGLISSLHCIGMCGPIAMMLPFSHNNPEKKALQIMTYHFGRIFSYSIIGLLFGIVGRGFYLAGIQQQLSIFAGVAMIVMVLLPANIFARYNFSRPILQIISRLKTALGRRFAKSSFKSVFSIGLLNGFLPCGMVYAAVFGALAMPGLHWSVLYMVVFGAGTIPLMSGVVYLPQLFPNSVRGKLRKIIPIGISCLGILFILRGLGIGVPFISPGNLELFVQAKPNCH